MSDLSATEEQNILNNIASGGVYVALYNADDGDDPANDSSNEVQASDYSREHLAEADITVTQNTGSPSQLSNDAAVQFGTTSNDWGTLTHAALWSDAADGTSPAPYTATIALDNSGDAPSGIDVEIPSGSLTFDID